MLARALSSRTVEIAVARLLALDPGHARLLEPIAGKVIAVEVLPWRGRFWFSPTTDTVLVLADCPGEPDVVLRGSPLGFARMMMSGRPQTELFHGSVTVEGDMGVARRLQEFLDRLDLDWESWLAEMTGREAAARVKGIVAWHRQAWETFQLNLGEFLQEETRALPAPLEAEDLYRRISGLRDGVERLEARVERLKRRLEA